MFKKGDKVKCNDGVYSSECILTVSHIERDEGGESRYDLLGFSEDSHKCGEWYAYHFELVQEKEQMFDMKKEPWFIRVENEQEFNAARKWLDENFGYYLDTEYMTYIVGLSNTDDFGGICSYVMWMAEHSLKTTERYETKLEFKAVVDSVTLPEVKTEQQRQIEELEKTILLAQQQIS